MTPALYLLLGITLLGVFAVLWILLRERKTPEESQQSLLLMQQQLLALQRRIDAFGQTVSQNLQQSTASMNERLDKAAEVVGD